MEYENFSEGNERMKEETKYWARLKLYLNSLKTDIDFAKTIDRELTFLNKGENNKPKRMKQLEQVFIDFGNQIIDMLNDLKNRSLRKIPYGKLQTMFYNLIFTHEGLYDLSQEYIQFNGNEFCVHPDYEKYLEYAERTIDKIGDEISLRQEMGMEN